MKQKTARVGDALLIGRGRAIADVQPLEVTRCGVVSRLTRLPEDTAELVRNAARLRTGQRLITTVESGTVVSRVEEIRLETN